LLRRFDPVDHDLIESVGKRQVRSPVRPEHLWLDEGARIGPSRKAVGLTKVGIQDRLQDSARRLPRLSVIIFLQSFEEPIECVRGEGKESDTVLVTEDIE